ncbi:cadherin-13-like [Lethenteron reissneri]|uniref:cadherin-13-like n=1 Tax=Lethenteron reissneri TaxID=7753 RepID=UPI002AB6C612|nr:cadherin-13-like [Lethenteron reissneri]
MTRTTRRRGTRSFATRWGLRARRPPIARPSASPSTPLRGDITTTSDPQLLDREALATLTYELVVSVSDMAGGDSGLVRSSTVTVTIADINDNPPVFHPTTRFEVSVEENVVRPLLNLTVRDVDERGSANWEVSFSIISGDTDGTFNVSTRPHSNRGILGLAQPLDYETWRVHALLVRADNLAPLVPHVRLPHASTATIVVSVLDTNEAPVFHHGPNATVVTHLPEGLQPGAVVARLNASDPDLAQQQTVRYSVLSDPARWLRVEALTGVVTTTAVLDRESVHVNHGHDYEATFLAYDNGHPPASSTATLLLRLSDENDHAPAVTPAWAFACTGRGALANRSLATLVASDPHDLPGNAGPFTFRLGHRAQSPGPAQRLLALLGVPTEEEKLRLSWRLDVINETHADLVSLHEVARGEHLVPVSVADSGRPPQTTLLVFNASVCSCSTRSGGTAQPLDCSSGAPGGPPRRLRAEGVAAAAALVVIALFAQGAW